MADVDQPTPKTLKRPHMVVMALWLMVALWLMGAMIISVVDAVYYGEGPLNAATVNQADPDPGEATPPPR